MASIKKISERKYKITVCNGYSSNGKKIARAKTIDVPEDIRLRSIPQYVAHEAEELERLLKSGYTEDAFTTFEQYARKWLSRQVKYAPSTLASYRRMLEVVYPYIGNIPLSRLRPIALENMMVALRKRVVRGKVIQETTAQKYLTVVSAVLSDAKRNEIIQKNPAHMVELPMTKRKVQRNPTYEEAQEIMSAICELPYVYRVFYFLAMYTGCRRGELAALKWSDFTTVDDTVILTISHSRTNVPDQGIVDGSTKNGRSRQIIITEDVVDILRSLRYQQNDLAKKRRVKPSKYLFTNDKGKPIHPDTFSKVLRRLYDENGFPKEYHLHTMRHYFVTTMLHCGIDKQTVADLAGHCDTGFLERTYCHPVLEMKKNAANVMMNQLTIGGK